MLNIYYFTPVPSLIFICVLSMSYLAITDVSVLMNYVGFVEALFLGVVMAGLVRLRYKQPNLERPIKVHISLPLIFLGKLKLFERTAGKVTSVFQKVLLSVQKKRKNEYKQFPLQFCFIIICREN
ncbi:large neutral amino acids transporter small subunit 2 [Caerostris extrusa]|uniref:Large neutral amino acids transporter small subunit 2 n=1 Tax=Caerostris extrusa TaxID=172846 RepID=A0AAV4PWP3_CAEEX|nr:large neutral amino acids transporter small subunit 2 [Caerostris extrusa]